MKRNHSDRWLEYLTRRMQALGIPKTVAKTLVQEWLESISRGYFLPKPTAETRDSSDARAKKKRARAS